MFALIGTAALFFFFRFYNLLNRITFDWDQETLSFQIKDIIVNHNLILIGHRATDAMGFYFGPYFEYLFVPFYFFSNLHPIALVPFIVIVSIFFFVLSYFIVSRLFTRFIAIAFLFFWAVNPFIIAYDITVWAPLLIPIGIMLTWYLLWRIYHDQSVLNFAFLGVILGLFTQIHSLYFFIDIFTAVFLILMVVTKKVVISKSLKQLIVMTGAFLIFMIPLLLFDVRHNFMNLKLFFGYFAHRAEGLPRPIESLEVFSLFMKPFIITTNPIIGGVFYAALLGLLMHLSIVRKKFDKIFYISALAIYILTALVYLRYSERPSEYYFLYLYPFITVAISDFLYRVNKVAVVAVCVIFFMINLPKLSTIIQPYVLSLSTKEKIAKYLKTELHGKSYRIKYEMPLGWNTGYEYLFQYYDIKSSDNSKDPVVILRSPARKTDVNFNKVGVYIPKELK